MHLSDEAICDLLKKGEIKDLEYLFQEYYKPLVLWADTFLNDIALSEDLVQEFFVKLWEKELLSGLTSDTLKSYLYTSVRNRAFNALSKKDTLRNTSDIAGNNRVWEEYDDWEEEVIRQVEEAVGKLPPRSREIVECVYLQGMKYKEVAEKFEISVSTVKTLLVNSLKTLRKETKDEKDLFLFLYLKKIQKAFNRF